MKLTFLFIALAAASLSSCTNDPLNLKTPAVQAQVVGDVEKDLIAAGGALLMTGGNGAAAAVALSAQEMKNLPDLQKKLDDARAAAATAPASAPASPVAKQPVAGSVTP